MKLINVGFKSFVQPNKVLAIVSPNSAPTKRMIREAAARGTSINGAYGRRCKSVIVLEGGYIMLSALDTTAAARRFNLENEKVEV